MGWDKYYNPDTPVALTLPAASLGDIITLVKKNLAIDHLKFIGDPAQLCRKVALSPGAADGKT